MQLSLGIGLPYPHSEGVHVAFYFGDWEGAGIGSLVCFGERSGDQPIQVVDLVEIGHIGHQVGITFEPGAVSKDLVRVLLRRSQRPIHEAETGG
jgi:hypothetical protein